MQTVTQSPPMTPQTQLYRFLGGALLGLVGLFVLLRLPSLQAAVLEPWSAILADLAAVTLRAFGQDVNVSGTILRTSNLSLNVTTECSGLEIIGVYLALTLAYPAPWSRRLWGAVYGILLFQILNFLRIVGFFWLEAGPTFELFHSYLWPLVLVVAGCLLWVVWLRQGTAPAAASHTWRARVHAYRPLLQFGAAALVLLLLLPYVVESRFMYEFSVGVTSGSAWLLSLFGVPAQANACILRSAPMSINILPRCTSTPLYILYLAGAVSLPLAWRSRGLLLLVAVPVFYLLNVFRVVGLVWTQAYVPGISLFVGNFFFQISLILLLSGALGWWLSQGLEQIRRRRFWLRLTAGYAASLGLWWLLGEVYDSLVSSGYQGVIGVIGMISMTGVIGQAGIGLAAELPQDPYRILQFMPAFQTVILGAFALACLWRWQALLGSVLAIYVSQIGFYVGIATLRQVYAIDPHVRYFRAWVVAVPFVLVWMLARKKHGRDAQAVPTASIAPTASPEKAAPTRPAPALQ